MDFIQLARDLRLATIQNVFDQGLLTEDEARELLCGPLGELDETVYDDSGLLRSTQCPLCKGWGRFDKGGYLEECPECGGTGGVGVSALTSAVPDRAAIDTGDLILHKPSGEQCVVAAVEGNRVYWCGHPFGGSFSLADCELLKSASESERAQVLCDLVRHSGNERLVILARARQRNSVG